MRCLNRGFSLLESLVAIAFLAIAALAVVASFLFTNRLEAKKGAHQTASLLAFDSMEEARVLLKQDFSQEIGFTPASHPEKERFTIERTALFVPENEGVIAGSIKEITVIVTWDEGSGKKGEYRLLERFGRP